MSFLARTTSRLPHLFFRLVVIAAVVYLAYWILVSSSDGVDTDTQPVGVDLRQPGGHGSGGLRLPSPPPDRCVVVPRQGETMVKQPETKKLDSGLRNQARVLLVHAPPARNSDKAVAEVLAANRIKSKSVVFGKNLPDLTKAGKPGVGKFGAVVFDDVRSYLNMDAWNRELLDKYCKRFNAGIVAFVPPDVAANQQLPGLPVRVGSVKDSARDLIVHDGASMLRLVKGGRKLEGPLDESSWVTLEGGDRAVESVVSIDGGDGDVVVQIPASVDGIPKVLFGGSTRFWLNKLLLLDALSWVSGERIAVPFTRYMLVDIDDVFVGKNRFIPSDVDALLASQRRLAEAVPGFKFNLGFSGGYFRNGATDAELEADDKLIALKDNFWWFPHMWLHYQPHAFDNVTALEEQMKLNRRFAEEKGLLKIASKFGYSVAPHHSGVYPVHDPLYDAWTNIWNITVTSTEEYPHLRPARSRRGFVHRGVRVLPRQTCRLFTKHTRYDEFPDPDNPDPASLETSIHGGELFQTIVYNRVSVFMTHMPNYVEDRLAPYTFESVVQALKCWTNLELKTRDPKALAEIYFQMYPDEVAPLWGNPCDDKRHMEIWSSSKTCSRLPDLLIIGPQKTGTSALHKFLNMHPSVSSNANSPKTFEELQFFSGPNYERGIDWYMSFFPEKSDDYSTSNQTSFLFEKSATYFDKDFVPARAQRLLPRAAVLAILTSPSSRAYSWYHHMRAHDDPAALEHTFDQVVSADASKASRALLSLRSRCLEPGKYAQHLERWLTKYKPRQLHVVDGEELKFDPVSVMNRLQRSLDIAPFVDYADLLVFDKRKGFYCSRVRGKKKPKCLGPSKGRHYAPMKPDTLRRLRSYYRPFNEELVRLLARLGYRTPDWLKEELEDSDDATKKKEVLLKPEKSSPGANT